MIFASNLPEITSDNYINMDNVSSKEIKNFYIKYEEKSYQPSTQRYENGIHKEKGTLNI